MHIPRSTFYAKNSAVNLFHEVSVDSPPLLIVNVSSPTRSLISLFAEIVSPKRLFPVTLSLSYLPILASCTRRCMLCDCQSLFSTSVLFAWGLRRRLSERADVTGSFLPNLVSVRALVSLNQSSAFVMTFLTFNSAKANDQTECHKCGKKGHFASDYCSKASVPSYQSPFQPKPLNSSQHKPELRPTKDFEAKDNKVKAKMALLSSRASASKAQLLTTKVSSLKPMNRMKHKEGARIGEWVKISMRKVFAMKIGHGGQDEEEEAWDFKKLKYEVNDHEEQSEIRQIRRHILFGDQT
ncbi:hypothetical protein Tco_0216272 [Tanacetum coccineum]